MPQAELQGTFGFCRWSAVANRTSRVRTTETELALFWAPSQWLPYLLEVLRNSGASCFSAVVTWSENRSWASRPVGGRREALTSLPLPGFLEFSPYGAPGKPLQKPGQITTQVNKGQFKRAVPDCRVQCQSGRQQSASHGELGLAV